MKERDEVRAALLRELSDACADAARAQSRIDELVAQIAQRQIDAHEDRVADSRERLAAHWQRKTTPRPLGTWSERHEDDNR